MTDFMNANTINDLFRSLFALIDRVAYGLLGIMYEILFNVASADIFSNETVRNMYGRIQLILGVFMIFKLAITIIQGILNPDTFTDKKNGFGNIITRVITALVLLAVLTPINIPAARTEYEIQLNNNGLLFGTLYSLQTRILENNTLGRLILGTTENTAGGTSTNDSTLTGADKQNAKLKQSSNIFTSTVLKGFVRINVKSDGDKDETNPDSRVCEYIDEDTLNIYTAYDASPNEILALINASCEAPEGGALDKVMATYKRLSGRDKYVFAYMPIISTIVAVVFVWILLGEIITIAMRSIKLAVLRIIAPIPIISNIQPSKDGGALGAWTKSLTTTYLELFLHLAVIYFILFLIQDMIVNGVVINNAKGLVGILSMIFIWIGMFFFIKIAPKFIMNAFGIKSTGSNLGMAAIMGGTAMAIGGGGLKGLAAGALNGVNSTLAAEKQGKAFGWGDSWSHNRDQIAQIRTGDKNAHGGFLGKMTDRMAFETSEKQAEKMGIARNQIATLKQEADVLQAEAGKAERAMKLKEALFHKNPTDAAAEREYLQAFDTYQEAQTKYAKANSAYEKAAKNRELLGNGQRPIDIYTKTYRSPSKVITGVISNPDGTTDELPIDETGAPIRDVQNATSRGKYRFETDVKDFKSKGDVTNKRT